jgi:hypothetical protein
MPATKYVVKRTEPLGVTDLSLKFPRNHQAYGQNAQLPNRDWCLRPDDHGLDCSTQKDGSGIR